MESYQPSEDCIAACETLRAVVRTSEEDAAGGRLRALGSAGLLGLLASEAAGGSAMPFAVATEVMREAGALGVDHPLADTLLACWILDQHVAATEVMAGSAAIAVAGKARLAAERRAGGVRLTGRAPRVAAASASRWLLAPLESPAVMVLVDMTAAGVRLGGADWFDPGRPYQEVLVDAVAIGEDAILRLAPRQLAGLRLMRRVLHGAEMLGAAQACFAAGKTHVSTRRQFGKLLSSHQSVRHQLARDHLRLTVAALSIAHAAALCDEDPCADGAAVAAEVASSTAGEASLAAVQNAMQLHGALSFTWEAGLHLYLRRVQRLRLIHDPWTARAELGRLLWEPRLAAEGASA